MTTWELEFGTTQGLDDLCLVAVAGAYGHDGLSDAYASNGSLWLSEGTTHSSLESINEQTGKINKDWQNSLVISDKMDISQVVNV